MVERIGPHEAKRRVDEEGWLYLDVRSVPEFEQGHPDGAYNIPLMHLGEGGMSLNDDFLAAVERAFSRTDKVVVGCQSGNRSLRAAALLCEAGWVAVDQRAGFGGARGPFGEATEAGWQSEGLPVSSETAPGRSWAELSR